MDVFGITIPFWALLIGIFVIVFILWGVIKFALWIFIIIAIIIFSLIGLDFLTGVFYNIGL